MSTPRSGFQPGSEFRLPPRAMTRILITCGRVRSALDHAAGETAYSLDVWCEDDTGAKITEGEAIVYAAAPETARTPRG